MNLRPIEMVVAHLDEGVDVKGIRQDEQAALVIIEGIKYLVMVIRKPSAMEIN